MKGQSRSALVTGATGFVGRHLVAWLLARGYQVAAISIPNDPLAAVLPDQVKFFPCDVRETAAVSRILAQVMPEVVFHLAGVVRGNDLSKLLSVNVLGTDSLLRATSRLTPAPRVVIPGSAAEYGLLDGRTPVDERAPLRPISAYGVSKAAQTLLGLSYAHRQKVPVVIGRVFNITGPGEPPTMLCGGMASQIAASEAGDHPLVLKVGNLSPTRDYVDVRDMVKALWLLALKGKPGEVYNICSGKAHRVEDVIRRLVALSSLSITLAPDPDRQRPSDIPHCVGDSSRLQRTTGWVPEISLDKSLGDTLAWWRLAHSRGPTTPL